jgi:poly(A) polymerase
VRPKIYHATEHDIDSNLIDGDALTVIRKLKEAGYTAYLVGGGVRDLLVKRKPKDFDISTSALPEEIKRVFQRQCILIGRRFRLAHVRFGRKIFEVSTFRSGENDGDLITHDNEWGTPEEDVMRRDFTINGLLYDPDTHTVIDYADGWSDIHSRTLKTIGDPVTRFKQDPVRMLRLLKFRARFNFNIEAATQDALYVCKEEIVKSSPARLLEEFFRMLESGASAPFFTLMVEHKLLEWLFRPLTYFLRGPHGKEVYDLLASADKVCAAYGSDVMDRSILTACLLFPILQQEITIKFTKQGRTPNYSEIALLSSSVIKGVLIGSYSHFPRRISSITAHILASQFRLTPLSGKCNYLPRIVRQKDFSYSLKFLKLRSMSNPDLEVSYRTWKELYTQHRNHGDRTPHPHQPQGTHLRQNMHQHSARQHN